MVFLTKSFGTMASNDDKFSSVSGSPRGAKRWNFVCARTSFLLLFPRPYLLFSSRRRYPALPSLHRSFQHERVSTLSRWHVNLRSATLFKEYLDETFRSAFETRPVSCKMLWATRSISPFQWCNPLDSVFFLFFPFLTQKNILSNTHTHTHTVRRRAHWPRERSLFSHRSISRVHRKRRKLPNSRTDAKLFRRSNFRRWLFRNSSFGNAAFKLTAGTQRIFRLKENKLTRLIFEKYSLEQKEKSRFSFSFSFYRDARSTR